jgi:drug/metabolite transporter (DMT)-like permease
VYGAVYGFFFFDEKLEVYHLIGSIMVFIGIFMVKNNVQKI